MPTSTIRPIVKIVDVATGEEIERPMNDEEWALAQADIAAKAASEAAAAEAAAAKQAILDRLGLTAEEAKMLLS